MDKSFLVLKGNYSQRQVDDIMRIWDKMEEDENKDWILPIITIFNSGDMGVVSIKPDGEIKMQSLFAAIEVTDIQDKMKFFDELINHLLSEDQQKIYEKLHSLGCKIYK